MGLFFQPGARKAPSWRSPHGQKLVRNEVGMLRCMCGLKPKESKKKCRDQRTVVDWNQSVWLSRKIDYVVFWNVEPKDDRSNGSCRLGQMPHDNGGWWYKAEDHLTKTGWEWDNEDMRSWVCLETIHILGIKEEGKASEILPLCVCVCVCYASWSHYLKYCQRFHSIQDTATPTVDHFQANNSSLAALMLPMPRFSLC